MSGRERVEFGIEQHPRRGRARPADQVLESELDEAGRDERQGRGPARFAQARVTYRAAQRCEHQADGKQRHAAADGIDEVDDGIELRAPYLPRPRHDMGVEQ